MMKAVRERRAELLQEADARVCMLNDQALISGNQVYQDTRQALAVYSPARHPRNHQSLGSGLAAKALVNTDLECAMMSL